MKAMIRKFAMMIALSGVMMLTFAVGAFQGDYSVVSVDTEGKRLVLKHDKRGVEGFYYDEDTKVVVRKFVEVDDLEEGALIRVWPSVKEGRSSVSAVQLAALPYDDEIGVFKPNVTGRLHKEGDKVFIQVGERSIQVKPVRGKFNAQGFENISPADLKPGEERLRLKVKDKDGRKTIEMIDVLLTREEINEHRKALKKKL